MCYEASRHTIYQLQRRHTIRRGLPPTFKLVSQTNNLTLLLLASSRVFFKEICNSHLFSHIIIDFTISNPFTF
jgi:hypothetical protein